jgi:hypothetical protein
VEKFLLPQKTQKDEPLAKLLSELLQESSQDSGFSSQNFAMRWIECGSAAVHSES